jgi:hypothetical protein
MREALREDLDPALRDMVAVREAMAVLERRITGLERTALESMVDTLEQPALKPGAAELDPVPEK